MATSQFTIYSSLDQYGPGYLNGLTGSLITVLDACLVNGYTGKPAAGWSKPFANSGSVIGCYKQGSGSRFTLFVNDNGPQVSALGKEAWATGWEYLSSSTAPCGTGSGQFPLPAQLLTNGRVNIRKSSTTTTVLRPWMIFADASTFHLFTFTGDGTYYHYFHFGDIYSLAGSSDIWRCLIVGRTTDNDGTSNNGQEDYLQPFANSGGIGGHYIARTFGGAGQGSINVSKIGDSTKACTSTANYISVGSLPCPNGPDNSLYMTPVWVVETSTHLRGRIRGLYSLLHGAGNFSDGQIIQGGNDYAGKTFRCVKPSIAGGVFVIETSATVETND
jgi:hypothetical protein